MIQAIYRFSYLTGLKIEYVHQVIPIVNLLRNITHLVLRLENLKRSNSGIQSSLINAINVILI